MENNTAQKKVYLGNVTKRTGKYGDFFTGLFNIEKAKEFASEKGYVGIMISENKEKDKFGNTHSIILNEYKKPDSDSEGSETSAPAKKSPKKESDNDGIEIEEVEDAPKSKKNIDEEVGLDDIEF